MRLKRKPKAVTNVKTLSQKPTSPTQKPKSCGTCSVRSLPFLWFWTLGRFGSVFDPGSTHQVDPVQGPNQRSTNQ